MRTALASLIAAATFVSAAQAQPPASTAPAPATQPAPAAPTAAPPAATPAAPAAVQPGPAPSAAPPSAAPTEQPAAPATPAAEAPPTLPTTGTGAVLLNIIEKVCIPLVRGGNMDQLAPQVGMKKNRRDNTWSMPLGADKNFTITMAPVGINKDVCRGEVHYAFDDEKAIVSALNIWSFLHQPELILQANYVSVNADGIKRVQKSWEHLDSASSQAVNFTTWTKPDDSPLNAKFATGEIFYQERKL